MIDLDKAIQLAKEEAKAFGISNTALDIGDAWIFDYASEVDISPIAVRKETGEIFTFFPPDYSQDIFDKGKEIDISKMI